MRDTRSRIPLEGDYAKALGEAAYCFAYCEWAAVHCIEKLQAGYAATVEPKKKTAGMIGKDLQSAIAAHVQAADLTRCKDAADEFERLVLERNKLLHGKPQTTSGGDQRLGFPKGIWEMENVHNFADEVSENAVELNDILHNVLP